MVGGLFGQSVKATEAVYRLHEFIDYPLVNPVGLVPGGFKEITFSNVTFAYPSRPEHLALRGLSLVIPPGKVTALVGHSGSGKSTVAQLVERFYPCDGVTINDTIPLQQVDAGWLRRNIGFINQEPVLFARNIRENIRYGSPHATEAEVQAAAVAANAHNFISALPGGYDTQVGERGAALSGGNV